MQRFSHHWGKALIAVVLAAGIALAALPTTTFAAAETGTPPTPAAPAWFGSSCIHVVQRGENLFRISLRFGVSVSELMRANHISDANKIFAGMVLRVPCKPVTFVVPIRFFPPNVFFPVNRFNIPFFSFHSMTNMHSMFMPMGSMR